MQINGVIQISIRNIPWEKAVCGIANGQLPSQQRAGDQSQTFESHDTN
jgi:hypothetical protein